MLHYHYFSLFCALNYLSDVDECSDNAICPEHSTCENAFGSFVCTCDEGYVKNGSVCIGKDSLLPSDV